MRRLLFLFRTLFVGLLDKWLLDPLAERKYSRLSAIFSWACYRQTCCYLGGLWYLKELQSFGKMEERHPVLAQFEVQYTQVVEVVLGVRLLAILINLVKLWFVSLANVEAWFMLGSVSGLLLRCNNLSILILLSDKECLCDLKLLIFHQFNLCLDMRE